MPYRFTLAVLHVGDQVLVINRKKPPYPGQWNGIGGKLKPGERPRHGMQREIFEETQLQVTREQMRFAGVMDWFIDDQYTDSIYLFDVTVPQWQATYPQGTREGILQAFPLAWLTQTANQGVITDFQQLLQPVYAGTVQRYVTNFAAGRLKSLVMRPYSLVELRGAQTIL